MSTANNVISLPETAARLGIHARTLQRMLADGTGPAIVRLSSRRIGILESDLITWIAARRRPLVCNPARRRNQSSKTDGAKTDGSKSGSTT
jgi:predicted DNA-binding transcriptional regulator AlpA